MNGSMPQIKQLKQKRCLGFLNGSLAIHNFSFSPFFFICLLTLISAIGLLKRKNWARIVFILLMGLGIAWMLLSIGIQHSILSSLPQHSTDQFDSHFQTMVLYMQIFSVIMAVGFTIVFGWIIRKLTSETIRQEFK